jgi:hypothetical protein
LVAEAQAAQTDRNLASIAKAPALAQRAKQGQPHVESLVMV